MRLAPFSVFTLSVLAFVCWLWLVVIVCNWLSATFYNRFCVLLSSFDIYLCGVLMRPAGARLAVRGSKRQAMGGTCTRPGSLIDKTKAI